jgi:hypothetical protein
VRAGALLVGGLLMTGCATSVPIAAAVPVDPAVRLHDADAADGNPGDLVDYQAALAGLEVRCQEPRDRLADFVENGLVAMRGDGIKDETRLTLTNHVAVSIPSTVGRMKCADVVATYTILRAPKH